MNDGLLRPGGYIDLRSDTVTLPTQEMRQAMIEAELGDDVYEDDPTVNRLETLAAHAMGKPAALFVPSGTMGNQIAVMAHTKRGDEIILGAKSHIVAHEVGGAAVLSGVSYWLVDSPDQIIRSKDVVEAIRGKDIHYPETGLLCLENALSNGRVVPLETMQELYESAGSSNIPTHLDGARIFNAAVYLGVDAKEIAKYTDSVMFCLSKGLCSPVGSILAGSEVFIAKARRYRKMLGGGMRQAGVLAACGIISLEKMTKRLHEDHENARYLADELNKLQFVNANTPEINLVFFSIEKPNFDHDNYEKRLLEIGVKANSTDDGLYRFVTHNNISKGDIDKVIIGLSEMISETVK